MKRHKKLLLGLITFVAGCASILSLSGCSYFVYLLDSTSGEGSVAGTYSFDISVYDSNYTNYLLNTSSAVLDLFSGRGITQTNTLTLSSDGTYTYTKELYCSTEGDSWYTYNLAVFYGNYTNSSNTVTLGEVTKIAYQYIPASIIASNTDGMFVESEYTETDDLTATSMFLFNTFTVVDLWYGPYFTPTGYGNVSQTIYIGSYSWGGFTFADDGLSNIDSSTDDDDDEETDKDYDTAYTLVSGSYYLYLFTDNTFEFSVSYMGNSLEEEGTWSYENQTLTITYSNDATQTSTTDGNSIYLYYVSPSYSSYINTTFTIDVDDFETWYNKYMVYFYLQSSSGMFWAYLYTDTYTIEMSYSTYTFSEGGTWSYVSPTLTLNNGETSYNSSTTVEGVLQIEYVFASNSQLNTTLECTASELDSWYAEYFSS